MTIAFIIGILVTLIVPILGIMAFGGQLVEDPSKNALRYFSNDFKFELPFIYYFTS